MQAEDGKGNVVIYCKGCGGMFYANARLIPEDVDDIVKYALEGHRVTRVTNQTVRQELFSCTCKKE